MPLSKPKKVNVKDHFQSKYSYMLTEPVGKNFDPNFQPQLTPKQMLELGVFGGVYLNDCQKEFPKSWFDKAKLSGHGYDASLNFFKIRASKPYDYWLKKGWIHPDDPRGWFQWYARYYMGRRHKDDARQIGRWKAFRRHVGALQKNCKKGDVSCRRKQRQALLHWAYDSRKL